MNTQNTVVDLYLKTIEDHDLKGKIDALTAIEEQAQEKKILLQKEYWNGVHKELEKTLSDSLQFSENNRFYKRVTTEPEDKRRNNLLMTVSAIALIGSATLLGVVPAALGLTMVAITAFHKLSFINQTLLTVADFVNRHKASTLRRSIKRTADKIKGNTDTHNFDKNEALIERLSQRVNQYATQPEAPYRNSVSAESFKTDKFNMPLSMMETAFITAGIYITILYRPAFHMGKLDSILSQPLGEQFQSPEIILPTLALYALWKISPFSGKNGKSYNPINIHSHLSNKFAQYRKEHIEYINSGISNNASDLFSVPEKEERPLVTGLTSRFLPA